MASVQGIPENGSLLTQPSQEPATRLGTLQTTGSPATGPLKWELREATRLEKRCPELSERTHVHNASHHRAWVPVSPVPARSLLGCHFHVPEYPHTLIRLGMGDPTIPQGTVELSSQPMAPSSSSQTESLVLLPHGCRR